MMSSPFLIGIDEVGRGSLAGPLVVGVVSLNWPLNGLKDSKKLSKKKREKLYSEILVGSEHASTGWVYPHEIDKIGLSKATTLAIYRAIRVIDDLKKYEIIIDGNFNYLTGFKNVKTIIKADDLYPCVSAASILAKVERDRYMYKISSKYPGYDLDANVGYGSSNHMKAIKKLGLSIIHRKSYKLNLDKY